MLQRSQRNQLRDEREKNIQLEKMRNHIRKKILFEEKPQKNHIQNHPSHTRKKILHDTLTPRDPIQEQIHLRNPMTKNLSEQDMVILRENMMNHVRLSDEQLRKSTTTGKKIRRKKLQLLDHGKKRKILSTKEKKNQNETRKPRKNQSV